jgi:ABC-type branched-subunit amino acid transport system ATPase component
VISARQTCASCAALARFAHKVGEIQVGEILQALKAQDFSILQVEQNPTLALRVANDGLILNTSRIVYHGAAEDAQNQPDLLQGHLGVY